jgi:hypothetical protein
MVLSLLISASLTREAVRVDGERMGSATGNMGGKHAQFSATMSRVPDEFTRLARSEFMKGVVNR